MAGANCPCGSKRPSWMARDIGGNDLFRVCTACVKAKMSKYQKRDLTADDWKAKRRPDNHDGYFNEIREATKGLPVIEMKMADMTLDDIKGYIVPDMAVNDALHDLKIKVEARVNRRKR